MKTPRQAVYSKDKLICTFVEYTNLKKTFKLKKATVSETISTFSSLK